MTKKSREEMKRVHIHMSVADIERIDFFFGNNGPRPLGRSKAITRIIRHYLDTIEAEAAAQNRPVSVADINLKEET